MITVFGFGSLLSKRSAQESIPNLQKFRLVTLPGYRRIFNKVGVVFFERYQVAQADREIASCATRFDGVTSLDCAAFECSEADFLTLYEREHRYRWIEVEAIEDNGERVNGRICTECSDDHYRLNKCITDTEYHRRVGQHYDGNIWRDDILPFPTYLRHCLNAVREQGETVYQRFLHTSYLADNRTSIAQYLLERPDIMNGEFQEYTHKDAL